MHSWQAWPQKPPELPSASSSVLKYLYGQEGFFFSLMSHLKAPYCHVNLFLLPILQRTWRTVSFLYLPGSLSYCETVITSHISFVLSGFKLEALQLSLTDLVLSPCSPSLSFSAWSPGTPSFLPVLNQTQLWEEALTPYRVTSSGSHIVCLTDKGSFVYHCSQSFIALHLCAQSFLSVYKTLCYLLCIAFSIFFFPEYFSKCHIHCEF